MTTETRKAGVLENGTVRYAPQSIIKRYNPYPFSLAIADGYKEVIDTPCPSEQPDEGYRWESRWEDGDVIEKIWEQVENEVEPELEPEVESEE